MPQPAQRRSFTAFWVAATVLALGVLTVTAFFVVTGGGTSPGSDPGEVPVAAWETSGQDFVLEELGNPQSFQLSFGQDIEEETTAGEIPPIHRFEYWDYYDMGCRFVFKDGVCEGVQPLKPLDFSPYTPEYTSVDLALGMTEQELIGFFATEPSSRAEIVPGAEEDVTASSWGGQLVVVFKDGGLIAAETAPIQVEGVR